MNFYPFHVGDYTLHTSHLTIEEDIAYRRLIDLYYTTEQPITLDSDRAARLIRMVGNEAVVASVLAEFFQKTPIGYFSKRCEDEIAKYQAKAGRAVAANNKRWEGHSLKSDLKSDLKSGLKRNPNQEPRTNNQEPGKPKSVGASASRLPADWSPSEQEIAYCQTQRPDLQLSRVIENFRDYWTAKGGASARKVDWSATWRTWVRNEKSVSHAPVSGFKSERQRNNEATMRAIYGTPQPSEKLITGESQ